MLNLFRNLPLADSSLSVPPYPHATKPRSQKERQGFLHKLLGWSETLLSDRQKATDKSANELLREVDASEFDRSAQVADLVQQGYACVQEKDWNSAAAYYRRAIQLEPKNAEYYQCLAEILSHQGELEEAATYYRQAIELAQHRQPEHQSIAAEFTAVVEQSPQPSRGKCEEEVDPEPIPWFEQASFHLQQAIVSCNAGEWEDTISACQLALTQLEPEAAMAYLLLGRSFQRQQQFAEAEQNYHKALTLKPNSAETHARLASLYAEQNRLTEAAQAYQTAIQIDPTFAGAYWKLAEVWQVLGEESSAATCLYQAFQLQPAWGTATDHHQLGDRLFKLGKLDSAQTCYDRAIRRDPTLADAYLGMGTLLLQRDDRESAIQYYQKGIQHCSDCVELHLQLGYTLHALENWQAALHAYQQALEQDPVQLEALAGSQTCCCQLEQWEAALIYSQKLVALQPQDSQHWHQLGDIYSRLQRWSEAVPAYERAIQQDPTFSWSHNNLGDALIQLEQWQAAINPLRTAIVLNPDFVWSHYNLAEALVRLKDWDGAIEAYRTALSLQPDLPYAAGHLAEALQQRAAIDRNYALECYRQEIQQNPNEPETYYKALELQADSVELYLGLADALVSQERIDEALTCCQIARQLQPEVAEINAKLKHLFQLQSKARQPQLQDDQAAYDRWIEQHTPTTADLQQMAATVSTWSYQPLISIIMPVYNTPIAFLEAAIQSVLNQIYPRWQLCIADDASADLEVLELLNQFARQDSRIRVFFRSDNGHIAAASNSALSLATGEFVAFLDHDDVLAPEALYEVASLLNQHPEADMIYSDEDKLDPRGKRVQPFFKPDWCPDSFLSRMYTCHLGVYRRQLVETIGGFRLGYEGSQDYDLVLRLTEKTDRIFHISKVLYHWRHHAASAASNPTVKPYAEVAAKQALFDACERRGEPAREIIANPEFPGAYIPRYQIQAHQQVSIIVPTRNLGSTLDRCLHSIFQKTTYPNYQVILIDNGSDEVESLRIIRQWGKQESQRLKCYSLDIPFNYSKINNYAASKATGDYLLFLNNDTEVITGDWIEAMVEQAQRPSIGAVGALLFYPDDTIQHAGVVLGIGGIAGHSHKYFDRAQAGYFSQVVSVNNYSAVTGACLMCRRSVFEEVGGFDESLAVAFNDVDFCLKLKQQGYHNIYLPHVMLYHHESKSRGAENTLEKQRRLKQELETMQERWQHLLYQDDCYSPHLTLSSESYSIKL